MSCVYNWMQSTRMFLRLRTFLDDRDLTLLMNPYQTRRQIPDNLCLDQPAGCIPAGTAHVSRGFSAWTVIAPPLIHVASRGRSRSSTAVWNSAVKLDFTGIKTQWLPSLFAQYILFSNMLLRSFRPFMHKAQVLPSQVRVTIGFQSLSKPPSSLSLICVKFSSGAWNMVC